MTLPASQLASTVLTIHGILVPPLPTWSHQKSYSTQPYPRPGENSSQWASIISTWIILCIGINTCPCALILYLTKLLNATTSHTLQQQTSESKSISKKVCMVCPKPASYPKSLSTRSWKEEYNNHANTHPASGATSGAQSCPDSLLTILASNVMDLSVHGTSRLSLDITMRCQSIGWESYSVG